MKRQDAKSKNKKIRVKARLSPDNAEDAAFAKLIDKGMETKTVSKASVMKFLE